VKLLIEPDDGVQPLLAAMDEAKKSIEIAIFRCDHPDIESALVKAIKRGVMVQALIAFTNRGGQKRLRELEARLLAAGAVVARTNNDLARYHAKYLIVDRKKLLILGFNFTRADLKFTRSFGLISTKTKLVEEASELFATDCSRQEYKCTSKMLVVSPLNARERLAAFLEGAKKELLIYDLEVSDPEMLKILRARAGAGVEIRIIGKLKAGAWESEVRAPHPLRLHARTIVRDRKDAFLGSQSLRQVELDRRREVGVLIQDEDLASQIAKIFEKDWESAKTVALPAEKVARRVAKAVVKDVGTIAPVLEQLAAKTDAEIPIDKEDLDLAVKEAIKTAVQEVVHEAVIHAEPNK
jgi:phosphatidylserine/phosphatidylglycerophosphate/cardiolipin synthase-like enzyme